jgi:hypothetical protein
VLVKDRADLVVLDSTHAADLPGVVYTVTRSSNAETLAFTVPPDDYQPILGWRDRTKDPRKSQAGDAGGFDHTSMLLPAGFQNRFLNGMVDPQPFSTWVAGETITVKRTEGGATVDVRSVRLPDTVPAATLVYRQGAATVTAHPPMRFDTVVVQVQRGVALTVWRATWNWAAPEAGASVGDADYVRLEVT